MMSVLVRFGAITGFANTDILNATTVNVNSFIDHLTKSKQQIIHSAVIGSEPTELTRGTSKLKNENTFVHILLFQYVNDYTTMTVVLTPHSTDTYRLAVVEKNKEGF